MSDFVQQQHSVCDFHSSDSWVILSPIEQSIKRKIEAVGTPLKDWDIQINYGIKTGFNDAFIITTEKRQEILERTADYRPDLPYNFASPTASLPDGYDPQGEFARTAELIRPILRGRDIKRYGYNWANLWLINTHNGVRGKFPRIDINDYPAVKQHLDQYYDAISKRADKGDTPYNLRNCAYLEDFFKPKIVYQELSQGGSFAIDKGGCFFVSNTGYLITGEHLDYLLQVLNSPVIEYVYRHFYGTTLGTSGLRWLAQHINDLPIPPYKNTMETKQVIDATSDNLLSAVGRLYGLSAEELATVETQ